MSGEILFLAHRIPFPPDRGDKIRSHHILKALARLAPVHVATFADNEQDRVHEAELAAVAATHRLALRSKPLALAGLEALATHRPVSLPAFDDAALRRFVRETLRDRPIATIYVFSSQMAQYVPADFAGRVVMDFVDVDSAKFEAYAEHAAQPRKTLYRREARLLSQWEEQAAQRAAVSLFVTEQEAALFRARLDLATRAACTNRALGNGIDFEHFSPALARPEPRLANGAGPHLLFAGQMDYPPNVSAAVRFARLMPAIRERFTQAAFHVVGRNPTAAVQALDGRNGTTVWGRVDDMRPWLAAADIVVAPLEIARGVQNKVLEALAMARPVLASSEAATGVAVRDGVEIAIADSDAAFVDRAIALLGDPETRARMGDAGRQFAMDNLSWAATTTELAGIVRLKRGVARDAA